MVREKASFGMPFGTRAILRMRFGQSRFHLPVSASDVSKIERVDRVPWQIRAETEARAGGSCGPIQTGDARDRQPLSLADAR
jgi:hypothetical protein